MQAASFWPIMVVLFDVLKDDEMKTDADKKMKPKRPRKVIKKSYMEDSYPTYLQVCMIKTNCEQFTSSDIM